jgi:hypothetical protein
LEEEESAKADLEKAISLNPAFKQYALNDLSLKNLLD